MSEVVIVAIIGGLLLLVLLRALERALDQRRIRRYVEARACEVIELWEIHARPAAHTWRNTRVFQARFRDAHGSDHLVRCETSMRKGVYVSDEQIIIDPKRRAPARATPRPPRAEPVPEPQAEPART